MTVSRSNSTDAEERPTKVMTAAEFFNVGTGLPAAYVLLALAELSSHLSAILASVVYAWFFLFSIGILLFILYDKSVLSFVFQDIVGSTSLADTLSSEDPKPTVVQLSGIVLPSFVTFAVAFAQLCRYLSTFFGGFSTSSMNYWAWIRMSASWVLDNGLFNFGQIFGWHISAISPTMLWSKTLILFFNVVLDVLAFAAVLRYVRAIAGIRIEFGPRKNLHWPRIVPFAIVTFLITASWLIPTWTFAVALANLHLASLASVLTAVRVYAPPVFALWTIYWCIWGFKPVASRTDRVVLLVAIAASLAILYFSVLRGIVGVP